MQRPLISIIIPARNAQNTIKKCLDSIFLLDYDNYELIVIDDGSTDETAHILSGYNGVRILGSGGRGPAKAKNMAIEAAKGEYLAFTDSDCIVDKLWLKELLEPFTNDNIVGVGGIQKSPEDESSFGKTVQSFFEAVGFITGYIQRGKEIRSTNHNPSCNVMYRSAVLKEAGGFLLNLWPGEDVELDYRLKKRGYSFLFNPKAVVLHYRPKDLNSFMRMMLRYGISTGILTKKYGFFRPIQLLPVFLLLIILSFFYNLMLPLIIIFSGMVFVSIKAISLEISPLAMIGLLFASIFSWNLGFIKGIFIRVDKSAGENNT